MARARIDLETIEVVNKREELGKDEAYLWVIGLQIIVPRSNVAGLEFSHRVDPLPGNLGPGFKRGEIRAIPPEIGHIEYDVSYPGRALFGVVVFAWDHDRTPNASIHSAYEQCMRSIDRDIRAIIDAILLDGVDPGTEGLREVRQDELDGIRDRAKKIVKDVIVASLALAPFTLDFDDFIGAERVLASVEGDAPFEQRFTLDLRKRPHIGAHYRVRGTLRFTPPRRRAAGRRGGP